MPQITPASALWNNRQIVLDSRDRLKSLYKAVNWANDLSLCQWVHWFTMAMEFKPDLIIELGRGLGNSTCLFTEVANQIGNCRVVSLCLSDSWQKVTKLNVAKVVDEKWFQPLDARIGNMLETDVHELIGDSQRILVCWDAHGYRVADFVLGALMPFLRHRQHIVLMHDISDTRYTVQKPADYQGKPLWRGNNDGYTRLILGHLDSAVEQVVAIVDFTSRNCLSLSSSDHSFHTELQKDQIVELQQTLSDELFSQVGHWFWFSLNEKEPSDPIYFPKFIPPIDPQLDVTDVQELRALIKAMESSGFWKLRNTWMKFKKLVGLGKS